MKCKNEYSSRTRLYIYWVPGPKKIHKKKKKKKNIKVDIGQAKTCTGDQASEGEADGEEGEWASVGVPGSPG